MKKENIPNILTIIRFILIPFIYISVLSHHYLIALIIFTVSALTDILDGYIARKYNYITDIGKLIDPLADKLTQLSLLLSLAILKILPWWIFAIVFIKELVLIVSASVLYSRKDVVVYSKWYGKLATTLFYLAIVASLIINQFDITMAFRIDLYLYYLAILATVFALIMYSIKFEFKREK
ncbi:MAG: CDP-alcohol phosphatidyltransferase family protein [Clostridia bacterium]|nr:CDP-alcohol phosphatidyltransferase family protein [Clostridia bacterium]